MNPTKTIDQSLLPQRLRESAFRRYERVITKCVEAYPSLVTICDFSGLSVVTYAARLRDAMLSLNLYRWDTKVDLEKFKWCYGPMKVSHRGDKIYVGPKIVKPPDTVELLPINITKEKNQDTFQLNTLAEKTLICRLAAARKFVGNIKVFGITANDVIDLESNYDVSINPTTDGGHDIL